MSAIAFFETVSFKNFPITSPLQNLTETIDSYFYLGGLIAQVARLETDNTSYRIDFVQGNPIWWQTALKIISYFTVVIPLILLAAKAILRNQPTFKQCTDNDPVYPQPSAAPNYDYHYDPPAQMKAPLIMVRSQIPTELKISVLYTSRIAPMEPIVPKPSQISSDGKYTWQVSTHGDGTMTSQLPDGSIAKINMIWWEAIRNGICHPIDQTKSVCIHATRLKEFLKFSCNRIGATDEECEAFTSYWDQLFRGTTSHLLVQFIEEKDHPSYLPDLEIESLEKFTIKRGYFRFQPIGHSIDTPTEQVYLNSLPSTNLGPNAVIDLGGELAGAPLDSRWTASQSFNDQFSERYIYC